ncbi:hypothetical protein NGRA_1079 [Nosema granulosis]|uniref:Uncharacterized protein n=1 Tax=Nosema granulosis TaxID=83296 RepID=A0A9P6H0S3_9MICR|nr:hypothetical protein NGRA_1079 [Nosema granulosis]
MDSKNLPLVLGCVGALGLGTLGLWFFLRSNSGSGAGKVDAIMKNAMENLKEPLMEEYGFADETKFKIFIAGAQVLSCLKEDEFKKLLDLKDDNDNKEKTKKILGEIAKEQKLIIAALKVNKKEKAKEEFKKAESLKNLASLINNGKLDDMSKIGEDPQKTIIERLQEENKKEKETLTSKLVDEKSFNIVDAIVASVSSLFDKQVKEGSKN